jgi:uncharacterized membrane protein YgcG
MTLALPILLLGLFCLSFWLLVESKVKWQFKTLLILGFCFFTIVFYQAIPSFLGWGAKPHQLPEILSIRSVVIKEPNLFAKQEGGIYFLIEQPAIEYNETTLKVFSYNIKESEPRLFVLPYSRKLHELLAKNGESSVISRTQRGQMVRGSLVKGFGNGKGSSGSGQGKAGKGFPGQNDSKGGKGSGSESQEQEWIFYDLKPSYFQEKH